MNEGIVFLIVVIALVAMLVLQRLKFKESYVGYKSLKDAIVQSEGVKKELLSEVTSLQSDLSKLNDGIIILNSKVADSQAIALKTESENVEASEKLLALKTEIASCNAQLLEGKHGVSKVGLELAQIEKRISHLLDLEAREVTIEADIASLNARLKQDQDAFEKAKCALFDANKKLDDLMSTVDLYSRIDDYVRVGHFEMPNYLYESSVRYQAEIKETRKMQRDFIKDKCAIDFPEDFTLSENNALDKKILDGQIQLMLSAFNIECDLLIEKINPSNLDRTLQQIEKKAEALEKSCATMKCGFNIRYVELKFEECKLYFEYVLKKKEEQDEQREIRERMREEIRVQKQYEEAFKDAEREELKFNRLLERARAHLEQESEHERAFSLAKISLLEDQLKEAQERSIRAKSMAEQTKRGYVYVISNIGAFGEGVYKIGLTRRLDPQERVDELSSASVPFPFDVHAMCYSEDAPALERALHAAFSDHRVNAVNFRKEFFKVDLGEIQSAIEEMIDDDVEFVVTAKADAYYQSKRLLAQ